MARILHRAWGQTFLRFVISTCFAITFYFAATEFFCPTIFLPRHQKLAPTECTHWKTSNSILLNKTRKRPQINLDPNKFLLPILYNGPNNQLGGLRQAVYLAIILNRTLVMPFFHKHITDEYAPGQKIDANHRFRVDALSGLLSVTSLSNYFNHCGKNVGVVFEASSSRAWMVESLEKAEEELGLSFLFRQASGKPRKSSPFLPSIKVKKAISISGDDRNEIRNAYQSDEACALYTFPFREIKMKIKVNAKNNEYQKYYNMFSTSLNEVPSWSIFNSIALNTKAPYYVEEFTDVFLKYLFEDKSYLALHWRYDMEDFHKFMCDKEIGVGNPNQAEMCKRVYQITPETLGQSISKYIESINKTSSLDIQNVYIATPQTKSAIDFFRRLEKVLLSNNFNVYAYNDIKSFMQEVDLFSQCKFLHQNIDDFLAVVEMEICARSRVFLRSTYSSWTDMVILNRELMHRDVVMRKYDKQAIQI